jgi:ribA/ribD-fused uncharacterized protein
MNKFTFFWHGPLSQWAQSPFKDQNGNSYNCCEQYMMAEKARIFGDNESLKKIMSTISPKDQKSLGRKVKGFNEKIWNTYSTLVVYEGNLLKFSQNPEFREELIKTQDTILVEASPYDKIWGISLREDDPRALNMETWQGENRLGFILTKIRDNIINKNLH